MGRHRFSRLFTRLKNSRTSPEFWLIVVNAHKNRKSISYDKSSGFAVTRTDGRIGECGN
jgi:hypothetical protein